MIDLGMLTNLAFRSHGAIAVRGVEVTRLTSGQDSLKAGRVTDSQAAASKDLFMWRSG